MSIRHSNRTYNARRRRYNRRLLASSGGAARRRRRISPFLYAACGILLFCITLVLVLPSLSKGEEVVTGAEVVSAAAKGIASFDDIYARVLYEQKLERAQSVRLVNFDHPNTEDNPDTLIEIKELLGEYATVNAGAKYADKEAAYAAAEMLAAAKEEGITTFVINSSYRSFETQQSLWNNRLEEDPDYGSDPYHDPVKVMPPTASEHCAGLAFDILSEGHPSGTADYGDTEEGKWLAGNAYKYGFILRYPKEKQPITGVIYEPWHFRYVGKETALDIYESGMCLEEYLISMGVN